MGILLLPTFIAIFSRAIIHLSEERGSIPSLIRKGFTFEYIKRGFKHIHLPRLSYLKDSRFKDISIRMFVINMLITAIYTIGVLLALYAALIAPERASTSIMASGLINGVATILLTIFIDPKISILADDHAIHSAPGIKNTCASMVLNNREVTIIRDAPLRLRQLPLWLITNLRR